ATGEAVPSAREERLAMAAVVEAPHRVPVEAVVPGALAARVLEHLERAVTERAGADGVEQQLDADAGTRALGQSGRKAVADLAGPHDVLLQRHRLLCRRDGLEHRRV